MLPEQCFAGADAGPCDAGVGHSAQRGGVSARADLLRGMRTVSDVLPGARGIRTGTGGGARDRGVPGACRRGF